MTKITCISPMKQNAPNNVQHSTNVNSELGSTCDILYLIFTNDDHCTHCWTCIGQTVLDVRFNGWTVSIILMSAARQNPSNTVKGFSLNPMYQVIMKCAFCLKTLVMLKRSFASETKHDYLFVQFKKTNYILRRFSRWLSEKVITSALCGAMRNVRFLPAGAYRYKPISRTAFRPLLPAGIDPSPD